jgi:hypothetical protein
MGEDTALREKREELNHQLAIGEYKTLTDMFLDGAGRLIQKLTRTPEPPSFWYSAAVIALVALSISLLTSILLGEFYLFRDGGGANILMQVWLVGIGLAAMIALKICTGILFRSLRDDLLNAIVSAVDLADLQRWLAAHRSVGKPLYFSLVLGVLLAFYTLVSFAAIPGVFLGFGPTILAVIFFPQAAMFFYYYVFLFVAFPVRLSRYQFKLYMANPSSSEVINRLSEVLSYFVYITAALVAIGTLVFVFFGVVTLPNIVLLVLGGWGPLVALFLANQYALAKIITRAKWEKLNELQAKIEKLETEENIADKQTMEAVNRLMDYYDRIKATPNSALDLRTGLNFLNSLLLPLFAFVLTNLDKVLELFS